MPGPTATTRPAGVAGWPIEHSLSPAIHNAAYRALGLDWVYVALPIRPEDLAAAVAGLAASGFAGLNVTMPHKEAAAALAAEASEDVRRLRAANVLTFAGPGAVVADNTDCGGFAAFLEEDPGFAPAGASAFVYGAGGAARACALAMARQGLARLTVGVRDPERARPLQEALDGLGTEVRVGAFDAAVGEHDLVLNATPVGQGGEDLPIPGLRAGQVVVDLIYRPAITPLMAAARAVGAQAFGGLGLLLHQAALTIERWTGQAPPMSEMSAAALAELAEDPRRPFSPA